MTRRRILVLAVVVMLAGVGALAWSVYGGTSPPPPALAPPAHGATGGGPRSLAVTRDGSYVGYRVTEEFVSFGVHDAVGRTPAVRGTVRVHGNRITAADLTADLRTLVSDQTRRDAALRGRGLESDRYPKAHFVLASPVALSRGGAVASGRLTLHGRTAPIRARLRGQRLAGGEVEVIGTAPIAFEAFGIDPPSVAGLVTVQDHGTLEFRLRLR